MPFRVLLRLIVLALGVASGCAPLRSAGNPADACSVSEEGAFADLESEVHRIVNRRRGIVGQSPLSLDERASRMARRHSQAMADGDVPIGHAHFRSRVISLLPCMGLRNASENVTVITSRRSTLPLIAVAAWLDSASHRANIFRPHDTTGVGIVLGSDGLYYVTQVYLRTR